MTIATDLGFKIGELYRVDGVDDSYFTNDMIVRFEFDDDSNFPGFTYISGPKGEYTDNVDIIYINLNYLVDVKEDTILVNKAVSIHSNKPLLLLYIQQQYPDDKVLKALVESI